MADRRSAESERLNSGLMEILHGFRTEKLSADFVMRGALFFQEA